MIGRRIAWTVDRPCECGRRSGHGPRAALSSVGLGRHRSLARDAPRALLLAAVRVYQRFVSPHKGFRCAYAARTGRASCSSLGYRAIRRHGAAKGLALIRARLRRCGVAHRRPVVLPDPSMRGQGGFCDAGCDLPCDAIASTLDVLDVASCVCDLGSCDGPFGARRKREEEQSVYIPPHARLGPSRHEGADR